MRWTLYDDIMATFAGAVIVITAAAAGFAAVDAIARGWGVTLLGFLLASFMVGRLVKRFFLRPLT